MPRWKGGPFGMWLQEGRACRLDPAARAREADRLRPRRGWKLAPRDRRGASDDRVARGWRTRGWQDAYRSGVSGYAGDRVTWKAPSGRETGARHLGEQLPSRRIRTRDNRAMRRRLSHQSRGPGRGRGATGSFRASCAGGRRTPIPTHRASAGRRPGLGGRVGTWPRSLHGEIRGFAGDRPGENLGPGLRVFAPGEKPIDNGVDFGDRGSDCQPVSLPASRVVESGR